MRNPRRSRVPRAVATLASMVTLVAVPAVSTVFLSTGAAHAAGEQTYVVAFSQTSGLPSNVDSMVSAAGGSITVRIPEIGGIGAVLSNPNFASQMAANSSVKAVDTETATQLIDPKTSDPAGASGANNGGNYSPTGSDAEQMPDSLGYEQWDKKFMDASVTGSYAVQRGRKDVRVFVIDTGADQTHIDVAPNLDVADSRSFVPTEPTIQDFNGHGTWTISAVGAPINGVGISGVAPNVTLVEGKVLDALGSGEFLWTDEALVYAGEQHFDVISASLGGFIPKCGSATNPTGCDHPDYILLQRATQFARSSGVLPVAALGNSGLDSMRVTLNTRLPW